VDFPVVAVVSVAVARQEVGEVNMNLKRILSHLAMSHLQVRKLFPAASMERITKAIADSELGHHGEIRFVIEAALDLVPLLKGLTGRDRAIKVFSDLGIWDTEANNGVLIYLLLADKDVEILGDRGLHAKVGAEGWEFICKGMEAQFRQGKFEQGALYGILEVGKLLKLHFPDQGYDINELPNRPVVL
jgi:uncharacterized membrane protein